MKATMWCCILTLLLVAASLSLEWTTQGFEKIIKWFTGSITAVVEDRLWSTLIDWSPAQLIFWFHCDSREVNRGKVPYHVNAEGFTPPYEGRMRHWWWTMVEVKWREKTRSATTECSRFSLFNNWRCVKCMCRYKWYTTYWKDWTIVRYRSGADVYYNRVSRKKISQ